MPVVRRSRTQVRIWAQPRTLPAYSLAEQDVPGVERVIQLGQNELGIAPSRLAIEASAEHYHARGTGRGRSCGPRPCAPRRRGPRSHSAAGGISAARPEARIRSRTGHANFVLVRFPGNGPIDAGQAFERLKNAGIIVRPTGSYGLSDCLRVTIGSAEEMAAVSRELARIVGARPAATAPTQPGATIPT